MHSVFFDGFISKRILQILVRMSSEVLDVLRSRRPSQNSGESWSKSRKN